MFSHSSILGRLARRLFSQPMTRWRENQLPAQDVTLCVSGLMMKVFPPRTNRIGRALYLEGVWEPEATGAFRSLIKPGDTVYDIGGDAGYYTLLFSKAVGPNGRVVVFEPIPKALERIAENLELNGVSNVILIDKALGSKAGSFVLEKPFEDSRINLARTNAVESDIMVQMERFDTLAARLSLPVPDLVKMDVEGAELEVLQGMEDLVRNHHPSFVIELHPQFLPQFGASVDDVAHWLETRGYHLTAVDAGDISRSHATTILARVLK